MGLRLTSLALVAALIGIGLFAASPFLCRRLVGTGESFNYSLSVADAVTQMRAGNVPPLVGQTLYAFNGRIHPLRNAPYLYYLAAAIDIVSRHKLSFWELQNASLAFSIVGAALACYLGLRRGIDCPPVPAFLLSAVYAVSPALLGAAYSFDLFMTVHAAVFVPLAVAACTRGCIRPSFSADAWLAAALAGAWFSHAPVAAWLTAGVVFVRVVCFVRNPEWRILASGACAVLLLALLGAFVFASVATLNTDLRLLAGGKIFDNVAHAIVDGVRSTFPASIQPVGRAASQTGDLQFGYAAWALYAATAVALFWPRRPGRPRANAEWWSASAAIAYVTLLLALLLPVPGLTLLLWHRVPNFMLALTGLWPMQRMYLVAVPFTLFGAAMVLPGAWREARPPRWILPASALVCAAWCAYQARAFINRGYSNRATPEATQSAYRPSNLDLTVTSYAYFGVPPTFVHGVTDPQFEFRLLRGGTQEIESPMAAVRAASPVIEQGSVRTGKPGSITLMPGRRYLLTFDFHTAPRQGFLQLSGPLLTRTYALPSAGARMGFGMLPAQRRSISIWTDGERPETVEIRVTLTGPADPARDATDFAGYSLQEVRRDELAVHLDSLFPLRFTVDAPESGCTVETPRCFLLGYAATANGSPVTPVMSEDRMLMVPVPEGHSVVTVAYPGSPAVRHAFWVSAASWAGFILWRLCGSRLPASPFFSVLAAARRRRLAVAAACIVLSAAAAWGWHRMRREACLAAVGPMQIDFALPYGKTHINQPLLTTGQPGAGVVVFVNCLDERHVRLGADVWGQLLQSEPIEVDFSRSQSVVVSDSALFPTDHPKVKALGLAEAARLRGEVRVELNGRPVIRSKAYGYETKLSEVQIGAARFGSVTDPLFFGTILGVRRLPIPRYLPVPWGRHVDMEVRFPKDRIGASEPLLSSRSGPKVRSSFVTYLSKTRLRISTWGPDGAAPASAEIEFDPDAAHRLNFGTGETNNRLLAYVIECDFDGKRLLEIDPRTHFPGIPPAAVAGLNAGGAPGVSERFTGPLMEVSLASGAPGAKTTTTSGPVHMILSFPEQKSGRNEPLLTTGRTGAGDLIFATYSDEGHIRLGYDHWGVGSVTSDPIAIDYKVPHEIWIAMSSLGGAEAPAGAPKVVVTLDGKTAVSSSRAPYPTTPGEVTEVQNRIGGSTADPDFSGTVHFVERTGPAPLPPQP